MVAGVVRRPLAQVLRNSLSGHPPPTGCDTKCPQIVVIKKVLMLSDAEHEDFERD